MTGYSYRAPRPPLGGPVHWLALVYVGAMQMAPEDLANEYEDTCTYYRRDGGADLEAQLRVMETVAVARGITLPDRPTYQHPGGGDDDEGNA